MRHQIECAPAFLCTCVYTQEYCIYKLYINIHNANTWPPCARFMYVCTAPIIAGISLVRFPFATLSGIHRRFSGLPAECQKFKGGFVEPFANIVSSAKRENGLATSILAVMNSLERKICIESVNARSDAFYALTIFYNPYTCLLSVKVM